jgi:hypothetical protein
MTCADFLGKPPDQQVSIFRAMLSERHIDVADITKPFYLPEALSMCQAATAGRQGDDVTLDSWGGP